MHTFPSTSHTSHPHFAPAFCIHISHPHVPHSLALDRDPPRRNRRWKRLMKELRCPTNINLSVTRMSHVTDMSPSASPCCNSERLEPGCWRWWAQCPRCNNCKGSYYGPNECMEFIKRHSNKNCCGRGIFEEDEENEVLATLGVWSPFDTKDLVWKDQSEERKEAILESSRQGNLNYYQRSGQQKQEDLSDEDQAGAAGSSKCGGALNAIAFTFTH